ncbi:MAG: NYN domain-containing protein [Pseudomonadota bacterium]
MVEHAQKPLLSAIFVDYDNVYLSLKRRNEDVARRFAKDARIWLDRIADGSLITATREDDRGDFTPEPRRLAMARCYGNPIPRRHARDNSPDMAAFPFVRQHFMLAGFEVADCPPLTAKLKNASDIRMVMDVRDVLDDGMIYDEFIILSGDADFTPLLHRLRARARRTVVYASAQTAPAFTSVCDAVIREELLLTVLNDGQLPEMLTPASDLVLTGQDTRDVRREIVDEVVAEIGRADGPVPLETLADKAQRALGHGRTAGSNWGGYGQFRALLVDMLPDHIAVTETAPFRAFDTRRELTTSFADAASEQVTAPKPAAAKAASPTVNPSSAASSGTTQTNASQNALADWPGISALTETAAEPASMALEQTATPSANSASEVASAPMSDPQSEPAARAARDDFARSAVEKPEDKPKRGLATTIAAFAARVAGTERDERAERPQTAAASQAVVLDPLPAWGEADAQQATTVQHEQLQASEQHTAAPALNDTTQQPAAVQAPAAQPGTSRDPWANSDPWASADNQSSAHQPTAAAPQGPAAMVTSQAASSATASASASSVAAAAPAQRREAPVAPPTPARPRNTHASIQRIYDASQAPILGPEQYRAVFQTIAAQLSEHGMAGASTVTAIQQQLQRQQIMLSTDDIRFLLEVVTENDPWFEQGVSANIFAGRFRNFVVARCRSQGLMLAAEELDLIDAWFAGAPLAEDNRVSADVTARAGDLRATLEQNQRVAAQEVTQSAPVAEPPVQPVDREVEVQADAAWCNIAAALGAGDPQTRQAAATAAPQQHVAPRQPAIQQPVSAQPARAAEPRQPQIPPIAPRSVAPSTPAGWPTPTQHAGAAVHASLAAQLDTAQERRALQEQQAHQAATSARQGVQSSVDDGQELGNLPRILRNRAAS